MPGLPRKDLLHRETETGKQTGLENPSCENPGCSSTESNAGEPCQTETAQGQSPKAHDVDRAQQTMNGVLGIKMLHKQGEAGRGKKVAHDED